MKTNQIANLIKKEQTGQSIKTNLLKNITTDKVPDKLELIEEQVLELKKRIQENIWLLGQRLKKIKEKKLYIEKYITFEEYIEHLDIGRSSIYNAIMIYESYDYVQTSGHDQHKLLLLAQYVKDKDKRIEYLKKILDEKLSFRKLKEILAPQKKDITDKSLIKIFTENNKKIVIKLPNNLQDKILDSFLADFENLISKYKIFA